MFITANRDALKRLQLIMKTLGYYNGKLDGVWSKASIDSMRSWESSGKFKPAYPTQGLPIDPFGKLPAGVFKDPKNPGFLMVEGMDLSLLEDNATQLKPKTQETLAPEIKTESTSETKPETEVKSEKTVTGNTQNQNQNHHKKKHKHRT